MLHNLRVRFLDQRAIYTWCGIVLVAVNPFSDLAIYGDETIRTYHDSNQSSGTTQLDPHIYAVAEDAFSKLERESRNQSLIVSGESGAGKTVSAKFAMRYFASIATGTVSPSGSPNNKSYSGTSSGSIERRVLASNPIMEAIGNAKTTRNDNSSRFGKYIQIMFDPFTKQSIVGGNMRTYLLEKSRITKQSEGERNFHLFYQICSYAKAAKLDSLMLYNNNGFYNFKYLGGITPCESDDMSRFNEAMTILGFSEKQQELIYKVVAAILHAGEIQFKSVNEEECTIGKADQHLIIFCSLLGLDEESARKWLTQRVLRTGAKEIINTPVNQTIAESGRDALVKFLYERMFNWVVSLINKALGVLKEELTSTFIGVLDIYGFEHFEVNSFEQFCINYANEVLQQQFNQHVFKLEQEEYVREGIDWTFITFTDNQPVIDLIEARLGILSLLDEECKMPKGNDESWNLKLYDQLSNKFKDIFQKPKFGAKDSFIVQHFADKVTYSVHGFLEKNRDTVWEEQIDLLKRSYLLEPVFTEIPTDGPVIKPAASTGGGGVKTKITPNSAPVTGTSSSKLAKATVGSQFRESLTALMKILNSTTPHYVRCIKSNDNKAPFEFDNIRAVQQLRACGVLETIRISSNGFPSRWTYQDFSNRYRVLLVGVHRFVKKKVEAEGGPPVPLPRKLIKASCASSATELRAVCEQIVKLVYELQVYSQFKLPFEKKKEDEATSTLYQFGKTKIFFRSGQVALLERIRTQRLRECAILIQKTVKGFIYRRRYLRIQESILKLQTAIRGHIARKKYWSIKCNRAATVVQTAWRCYYLRRRYLQVRKSILAIQKYGRSRLARLKFLAIQKESATITIQRWWRGYKARKIYQRKLRQIILVQSCVRRYFAKKQLKALKVEARSVQHVQQLNKGLERKIIELQQKLNEMNTELKEARNKEINLAEFKVTSSRLDTEIKNLKNVISDKDKDIEKLKELIETKEKYNAGLEKQMSEKLKSIEKLKDLNKQLENSFDQKAVDDAVEAAKKTLEAKFEQDKKILIEELENEKYSRQQLLRKYAALEEKLQSVETGEINYNDQPSDRSPDVSTVSLMMKCSELEQECAKVKQENQEMRELMSRLSAGDKAASDKASNLLAEQFASIQMELDRTKEEKTQLKTIVLGQESSKAGSSGDSEVISAFKMIVKQLEHEVDSEKIKSSSLTNEVTNLRKEIDRQHHLLNLKINEEIKNTDGGTNSDFLTRINQEIMVLREKCDSLDAENKKLRVDLMRHNMLENGQEVDHSTENGDIDSGKNYLGMYKYNPQKEQFMLDLLITNLEPAMALKFTPHLPAYIIFMCVRYTDEVNDDNQVRSLLNSTIMSVKNRIKRATHNGNTEVMILWLSNTVKLVICLKQFSGDEPFGVLDESLKNFDLSEYRQMFSDIAIWIYQLLIKQGEERLQPLIVPGVLEYEGLASSGIYTQPKQR